MKLKNLAKKGGVESIVGLIILIGLVILLIVVAVLPTMNQTQESAANDQNQISNIDNKVSTTLSNELASF